LRNLTLGALIVSVGTLAALPFRRSAPDVDRLPQPSIKHAVSVAPPLREGRRTNPPTKSPVEHSQSSEAVDPVAQLEAEIRAIDAFADPASPAYSWNKPSEPTKPQKALKPLTYEDLAVPLARPPLVQERFNAMGPPTSDSSEASKPALVASEDARRMRPLTMNDSDQQLVRTQALSPANKKVGQEARFTSPAERDVEPALPLPSEPAAPRQRYWIVQP